MLIRLTDNKGQELWINPIHVKLVQQRRRTTEIVLGAGATMSGMWSIKVREPMDLVAELLNAAMPDIAYVPDDGGGAATQAAGAATIATMG